MRRGTKFGAQMPFAQQGMRRLDMQLHRPSWELEVKIKLGNQREQHMVVSREEQQLIDAPLRNQMKVRASSGEMADPQLKKSGDQHHGGHEM